MWMLKMYLTVVAMNGENRPRVTDEPVEFEKYPVEIQNFRKIIIHSRGIWEIYLKIMYINM